MQIIVVLVAIVILSGQYIKLITCRTRLIHSFAKIFCRHTKSPTLNLMNVLVCCNHLKRTPFIISSTLPSYLITFASHNNQGEDQDENQTRKQITCCVFSSVFAFSSNDSCCESRSFYENCVTLSLFHFKLAWNFSRWNWLKIKFSVLTCVRYPIKSCSHWKTRSPWKYLWNGRRGVRFSKPHSS